MKRSEKYVKFFALDLFRGKELIVFFFNLSETAQCSFSIFFQHLRFREVLPWGLVILTNILYYPKDIDVKISHRKAHFSTVIAISVGNSHTKTIRNVQLCLSFKTNWHCKPEQGLL